MGLGICSGGGAFIFFRGRWGLSTRWVPLKPKTINFCDLKGGQVLIASLDQVTGPPSPKFVMVLYF